MKNPIPKFFVSRLKFVRQGSKVLGESGRWSIFLKVRIAQLSLLGWLDAFRAVKLGLKKLSCEKASLRL